MELQTAYATQFSYEDGRGEWIVYNAEREEIYKLPADWTEKQVMTAIHFGRKFELQAFNNGVVMQKNKAPSEIIDLRNIVKTLSLDKEKILSENIKLANELDKLTLKYN